MSCLTLILEIKSSCYIISPFLCLIQIRLLCIDTSLSYSPIRPFTCFLKTSKVELCNAKALKYFTFQSCSESQNILNYYIMSPSSIKFTKHEKKIRTKYNHFCSLHSKYKFFTHYCPSKNGN